LLLPSHGDVLPIYDCPFTGLQQDDCVFSAFSIDP
jgi:hypothetical protein